jgi:NADPH-dependent 2,4-dienoyl-CoA reductase/sulfur reductase-like enzyme
MNCPEGIFLEYAARVKLEVPVPVIGVGRLGNPKVAMQAVDTGKADFVALGRPLISDPDWPSKVRDDVPVRRCIACNRCVDEMRGGDKLGCVVNPAAARETEYRERRALPQGERIAVIGAGPAGLSYAALVADANEVTVFERSDRTGGALRYAGLAPQFQNVEADQPTLDAYLDDLERACRQKNVVFRLGASVTDAADLDGEFDRLVVATGARYRYGFTPMFLRLLRAGLGKSALARRLFNSARVKDWFYYAARRSTRPNLDKLESRRVVVIGDAAVPGKTRDAVESAFKAALWGE